MATEERDRFAHWIVKNRNPLGRVERSIPWVCQGISDCGKPTMLEFTSDSDDLLPKD
jgi:hypothetical protein